MIKITSKIALPISGTVILYMMFSGNFFSLSPFVIAIQLLVAGLSLWTLRGYQGGQFNTHTEPIDRPMLHTGPYQFIQRLIYAAALLPVWSSVFGYLSPVTVIIDFIVTFVAAIRIVTEDQFLLIHFPEYAKSSRSTKRIIPFLI